MIYRSYSLRRSRNSLAADRILGLHKGTDGLFKVAAGASLISSLAFTGLFVFALQGTLSSPAAGICSLIACSAMLMATMFYLTASKITSYRSLHQQ